MLNFKISKINEILSLHRTLLHVMIKPVDAYHNTKNERFPYYG